MFIIILIISFGGSFLVKHWMTRTYGKWSVIQNHANVDGHAAARLILDKNQLQNVTLETSEGMLSDHYIPSQKLIKLSQDINSKPSIAALAVAAHEVGHAIQDKENYKLSFGGSFLGSSMIMNVGILMMVMGMLMPILTLPIEFDASKRALAELTKYNLVNEAEYKGAKSMLFAAALTYVAGAASSMAIIALFAMRFLRR